MQIRSETQFGVFNGSAARDAIACVVDERGQGWRRLEVGGMCVGVCAFVCAQWQNAARLTLCFLEGVKDRQGSLIECESSWVFGAISPSTAEQRLSQYPLGSNRSLSATPPSTSPQSPRFLSLPEPCALLRIVLRLILLNLTRFC